MKLTSVAPFALGTLLVLALSSPVTATQSDALTFAKTHIKQQQQAFKLSDSDLENYTVTDQYTNKNNKVTHIFLRQQHKGIDVFGATMAIHITEDGTILKVDNQFIANLDTMVNASTPAITATTALTSMANHLSLKMPKDIVDIKNIGGPTQAIIVSGQGLSKDDIPMGLIYEQIENGEVRLAWTATIRQDQHWWNIRTDAETGEILSKNDWVVNDNDYRVIPMPYSNPEDGVSTPWPLLNNPSDLTASPYGWHDTDGTASPNYTDTRGNNVFAQEDQDDNDSDGYRPDGGNNLIFDYAWDATKEPTDSVNRDAAIANLFACNNFIHDIFYHYGFDEASGNFQFDNYDNGGEGNDQVYADAQDGSGTNNANFGTPPDGQNPRMQMFIWDAYTTPARDSSLDNTIIIHEYSHGISNRLVGGPSNTYCLSNSEQMGEGWSDWLSMAITIKSTDTGTTARGMGTYVIGQDSNGLGIRPARYTTDMTENGYTYGSIFTMSSTHDIGFVWASMLWELEWAMIDRYGFDADLATGTGGNNMAIQLVMDGLKLTNCSPGFVDGRDAILLADQTNYDGDNQCLIWEAFAKRGLGYSADQGSSGTVSDGTEAFDIPTECSQTLHVSTTASNTVAGPSDFITYTLEATNDSVTALTDVNITFEIPTNTDYVMGSASCNGAEDGGYVTFNLDPMASGTSQTCTLKVQVSNSVQTTTVYLQDDMEQGEDNWFPGNGEGDENWAIQSDTVHSDAFAWFAADVASISDQYLSLNTPLLIYGSTTLSFWHYYDLETNYDGGVIEISIDSGATWEDLGNNISQNNYTGTISADYDNPLGGRSAFTGSSDSFIETIVDLSDYANQSIQVRFRLGTDSSVNDDGWYIDDVTISQETNIISETCIESSSTASTCNSNTIEVSLDIPQSEENQANADAILSFADSGVWMWRNNSSWLQIHTVPATNMITGNLDGNNNDDLILDFDIYGVWLWMNNSTWQQLHTAPSTNMVSADLDGNGKDEVIITFENYGVWIYANNTTWTRLHTASPEDIITGDVDGNGQDDLIIDYGDFGLWVYKNNSTWAQLHTGSPERMVLGDMDGNGLDELILDFGQNGIWIWKNNNSWKLLHSYYSDEMTIGDIDGNGKDDLIIDFTGSAGIWIYKNNSRWVELHSAPQEGMMCLDLDNNGQDDIVINFGEVYGTYVWNNNSTWSLLHTQAPKHMTAGYIDDIDSLLATPASTDEQPPASMKATLPLPKAKPMTLP